MRGRTAAGAGVGAGGRRWSAGGSRLTVLLAALLSACRIQEVTLPLGEEVLVVQGIMTLDTSVAAQYIIVERSLTGTADIPDQDSVRGPPLPPLPVSGARVVVHRDDGDSVRFSEIPDTLGVYRLPYGAGEARGFFAPGREYRLVVEVGDGRRVTGRMRTPAFPVVTGMLPDGARFNRDRDTLRIAWSGGGTTKGIYIQVRPRNVQRPLRLLLFTDSPSVRLPGAQALPVLDDDQPATVWVAGTRQTLTVAALDSNYFHFFRTGNDPFTGAGFRNTLAGGMGVFGSVAPLNATYDVVGDVDHPIEGRYRLEAGGPSVSFDADVELYVTREQPRLLFAALLTGVTGALAPRGEGYGSLLGGFASGQMAFEVLADPPGQAVVPRRYRLEGFFANGSSDGVVVLAGDTVGSYRLRRLPAPARPRR